MGKKKTTQDTEKFFDSLKSVTVIGTPTAIFLPARNYKFKVYEQAFSVTLPREGKYSEIDPEFMKDQAAEFNFLQEFEGEKGKELRIPLADLSRVLFVTTQYPDLKDGQAFAPIGLIVRDSEVEVVGNIIEMIKEE
jgi:hypothetical protein